MVTFVEVQKIAIPKNRNGKAFSPPGIRSLMVLGNRTRMIPMSTNNRPDVGIHQYRYPACAMSKTTWYCMRLVQPFARGLLCTDGKPRSYHSIVLMLDLL